MEKDTISCFPGDVSSCVEVGSDGEGLGYGLGQISIVPPECPGSRAVRAMGLGLLGRTWILRGSRR